MHPLNRKLLRDLWSMRGQMIAICLVMASGMGTFVMSLSTLQSLVMTQATYYERYRFAHVFANLKRAPLSLAQRIEEIPGVGRVQTRVVVDVTLDVPTMSEPAVGRLISLPTGGGQPALNRVYLRGGRLPERPGEVLASEAFVLSQGLQLGDQVRAVINGALDELTIVGVGLSPEYVLQIRAGQILPDQKRFGVFWMLREELAPAYDMEGAFNDVSLTLMPGASTPEVLKRLDDLIEPFGGIGSYDREDQLSHQFLSDEIRALRAMGLIAPSIFLSVAAFLLNVVMTRLIATQREQIAALKAFGYTNLEVGQHYLQMVLAITVVGATLGTLVGSQMGRGLTVLYTQFYKFPIFQYHLGGRVVLLAIAVAATAAIVGTLGAIVRAVSLPPAQALRPEPPATFRPTIAERLGLQRLMSEPARMVMRQLERRPLKAAMSTLGIAMAVAVLVLGRFATDSIDYLISFQFFRTQRQDVTVSFIEPTSGGVVHDLRSLPGVRMVEPFRAVSVRMYAGHREERTGITGLLGDARLQLVMDAQRGELAISPEGLMMSSKLAELLQVGRGELVWVHVQEGKRPWRQVRVVELIDDYTGAAAYMHIDALRRLMQEGHTVSGAQLLVDRTQMNELYAAVKRTPRIADISLKQANVSTFEETIAENQQRMQTFNVIFAIVIAFGVVYNTVRISFAERSRELATLRVIGFTRGEVSAILLGELATLTLAAVPVGLVIGYGFAALAAAALDSELYRIPLVISRSTYGFASSVVVGAALISGLLVRRRIDTLDLVSVLKTKE